MSILYEIQMIIDSENDIEKFYIERTKRHIELVNKYGKLIKDNFKEFIDVDFESHDISKFHEPEYTPYTHITWKYKCLNNGESEYNVPSNINVDDAWKHHYKHNKHHPEYWTNNEIKYPLDVSNMPNYAIAEMVADWSAMSEEFGKNTPKEWVQANVDIKWLFTKEQKKLIYNLINTIWQ